VLAGAKSVARAVILSVGDMTKEELLESVTFNLHYNGARVRDDPNTQIAQFRIRGLFLRWGDSTQTYMSGHVKGDIVRIPCRNEQGARDWLTEQLLAGKAFSVLTPIADVK